MQTNLQTPIEIRSQIWKELTRSVHDKHHAWRTPVFSTLSIDGGVSSRTVVLRSVNESAGQLSIYTDSRSSKVLELRANPKSNFVFWNSRLRWQLRVRCEVSILTEGPLVESLWQRVSQSAAVSDYISASAPGSNLVEEGELVMNQKETVNYFTVLICEIKEMDWLELAGKSHRRAKITGESWLWLNP